MEYKMVTLQAIRYMCKKCIKGKITADEAILRIEQLLREGKL